MCIVSAVTGGDPWNHAPWYVPPIELEKYKIPDPWYTETKTETVIKYPKGQFDNWSYVQCQAYVELLEKAQKFDEIANEKHCSDPAKTESLSKLRERICQIGLADQVLTERCLMLANRLDKVIENL